MARLCLIMGDQLSPTLASLRDLSAGQDVIVMGELSQEATFVRHHKKKIALIFSAMRHFAKSLEADGFTVLYQRYDCDHGADSFDALLRAASEQTGLSDVIMTKASEYRPLKWQERFQEDWHGHVTLCDDDRFLATKDDFTKWASGKKQLRMEFFYREMRRKYNILLDKDKPVGGQWNYDSENRKPPKTGLIIPPKTSFAPDEITSEVLGLVGIILPIILVI